MPRQSRQSQVSSFKFQVSSRKRLGNLHLKPGTLLIVVLALVLFGYWAFVTFAPKPPAKPDATWTRILATGAFRVGIDPSFPPFESDDGKGHLKGLDIALIDEMLREWSAANAMPLHAEYIYTGFDGLYDALKASQFDAIVSALPYDPKRTEDVRFSHSYFNGGPFIVVREEDATTKTFYDLQNRRVGVELGSSGDVFARRWQRRLKYDLHEFHAPNDALLALRSARVDAVFTDLIAFNEFARSTGGIKTVGDPLANEYLVIAVRKDAPTLLAHINAVIAAMKSDGRMERLWQTWLVNQP